MRVAVTMLVFCVAALLALGMVMLYSSSMVQVGARYLLMQLVWGAIGLVALFASARIDYHLLRKLAWPLFALALVLVAIVVVGFGVCLPGPLFQLVQQTARIIGVAP